MRLLPRQTVVLVLVALAPLVAAADLAAQSTPSAQERVLTTAPARPFEAMSRTILSGRNKLLAGPSRDSLVQAVRSQVGLRYRLGAVAPGRAFDCSGLIKWALGLFDIELPRTAAQQARHGVELPKDPAHLLPGDLLYFGRGKRITHIGMYVGDGRYVHASNRRVGIVESPVPEATSAWWRGARRIISTPLDNPAELFTGLTPATIPASPVLRLR